MKFLIAIVLVSLNIIAGVITPKISVKTSAPVVDFVIHKGTVWAGTANGEILQITTKGKILSKVTLKPLVDYWGEKVSQRVMSLDVSSDGKTIILAAEDGFLYLIHEGQITKTSFSTKSVVKKVVLLSDTRAIVALLSNEVVFFDLKANKILKTISGGTSPLSDMALSLNHKIVAIAGEAGIVSLIDTSRGTIVKQLRGGNVDNIYKIDFQNNKIATAGQDRRAIVYSLDGKTYNRYDGTFLIYTVALSPSGAKLAASLDENNIITIFDTIKRQKIATAKGHDATLNRIVFIDEKRFVSCADENKILFWELP
ncbi:MAG: WD40 repeat domain-containing protein [Sulfuricurvum sp.]